MLIKVDENYYYSTPACIIYIEEILLQSARCRWIYEVRAIYNRETAVLKTFHDKRNAQAFAKRLVEMLNEEEPKC